MIRDTPYDVAREHVEFPFELYPFQIDATNELANLQRSGLYLDPGLGKTAVSTHVALYKMFIAHCRVICIVPPTLITQWARWLSRIRWKHNGRHLSVLAYQGTPAQRRQMQFRGHNFVLMSLPIFKKDIERIEREFDSNTHVILDEAQAIKDVGTKNYKTFRDFVVDKTYQLLTGTPLNNPLDAYAYIKLVAPAVYRNLAQFERLHVEERDFFRKPTKYHNLDLLSENLMVNSVRHTKEEVLTDLPEAIIVPLEYELHPKHAALYKQLAEEQLLKLPDGGKIDATQVQTLIHSLGQIVMQWDYFAQDASLLSAGYAVLDEVLEELNGNKLVVFANYRRTNAAIQKRYNCPGIWGGVTPAEKQRAIDVFLNDPSCRMLTIATSASAGIDGLQHACNDVLYVEPPPAVSHFVQSFSRVHREGQKRVVTMRMATALGTIHQHQIKRLSDKEALIQPLQGAKAVLRDAIFGR